MLEARSQRARAKYVVFPTICNARVHDPSVPNTVVSSLSKVATLASLSNIPYQKFRGILDGGGGGVLLFGQNIIAISIQNLEIKTSFHTLIFIN